MKGKAPLLALLLGASAALGAALPGWLDNPKRSNPFDPKSPLNKSLNPTPIPTPSVNHASLAVSGGWGSGNKQYIYMGRVKWIPTGQIVVSDFASDGEILDATTYAWVKNFRVYVNYPWLSGDPTATFLGVAWDGGALHVPESRSRVRMLDASFDNSAGLYDSLDFCNPAPELCNPSGIALEPGFIYIADTGHHRISKLDAATKLEVQAVGSQGGLLGQFESPSDIEVVPGGYWFVADWGNHRVQRFSSAGVADLSWGGFGSGPGQFSAPTDLSLDLAGSRVFVADSGNKRFQVFDFNGVFLYQQAYSPMTGYFDQVSSIDFDPGSGRLVLAQNSSSISIPRVFVLGAYP